ncbi:FHA domain-containing protein [Streptomyces sp. NPDC057445]|uniref:FHA domain-containing protein n=1 Tax=Streptomyces sp. NPDC057445 TaxID=3346136 RepID=UPI0036D0BB60
MQIRLTVLAPRSGQSTQSASGAAGRVRDVLVTAPAGTALAAVASGLAAAVSGPDAAGTVVLYAGRERLDAQRCALGEPPLVDGAVLSLQVPSDDDGHGEATSQAQLHVVAGPDAGGVHLLHGGQIRIGRAADADVPLDDPDVSRLHCAVTVTDDGLVTVADLGSTNGTTLDGTEVGPRPVRLHPGALLRLGESTLRLAPPVAPARLATTPDGEGHLRVRSAPAPDPAGTADHARGQAADEPDAGPYGHEDGRTAPGGRAVPSWARDDDGLTAADRRVRGNVTGRAAEASGGAEGRAAAATDGQGSDHGTYGRGVHGPDRRTPGPGAADRRAGQGREAAGYAADGTAPDAAGPGASGGTDRSSGADRQMTGRGRAGRDASDESEAQRSGAGRAPTSFGGRGAGAARRDDALRPPGDGAGGSLTGGTDATDATYGGGRPAGRGERTHRGLAGDTDAVHGDTVRAGIGSEDLAASGPGATHGGALRGALREAGDGTGRGAEDGEPALGHDEAQRRRVRGETGSRRRGIGAWARRLAGGRGDAVHEDTTEHGEPVVPAAAPLVETWPDPAAVLLTALGPGPRLWERGPGHPEELVVRLGTADRADTPSVPVTVGLREAGSLGLAGPRSRLTGLARSVLAQLAALHSPTGLEIVLISTDRARPLDERRRDWGWLGWLPHLRPAHGQDCRLLMAYDRDQATARAAELTRRLDDSPLGPGWPSADRRDVEAAAARHTGPRTVLVMDGDPGSAALRETTARLAEAGAAGGIHVVCLAETPAASPLSPVAATYEEACAASLAFRECGAVALLSGDVATALRLLRTVAGQPAGHGTVAAVDAVSTAWAERFGRALAPLRAADTDGAGAGPGGRSVAAPLPRSARLLDELGLARATPASLMTRWASASDGTAVLGAGPRGPLGVDLSTDGPHLLIEGPAGSGRTELLRAVAASLAAAGRPDRLGLLLVDGAGGERGEGLAACTELPHVTEHLVASDPVRMREFAQALGAELKRRAELLGQESFTEWHTRREVSERLVGQRSPSPAESRADARTDTGGESRGEARGDSRGEARGETRGDLDSLPSGTLRLRPAGGRTKVEAPHPLPRLVVLVDDYDALVAPALGSPGRPAAGSVVRALEAVARDGERLGVHLVATSARPDRTADTELAHSSRLRVVLDAPPASPGPDDPAPGRGRLGHPDGRVTPFQTGRVTGRIPRTATLRPTVVELEWERMGDPPARRPVRELGNGPTDLALLASALDRAARSVDAVPLPPLTPSRS